MRYTYSNQLLSFAFIVQIVLWQIFLRENFYAKFFKELFFNNYFYENKNKFPGTLEITRLSGQ